MRFKELKLIADIREGYQVLEEKISEIKERTNAIISQRKTDLIRSVTKEFDSYFTDSGFAVTTDEDGSIAEYKTVQIALRALDPGRRQEDVTCLVRFKLIISASDPETYDVFARWSGISDIKNDDVCENTNIEKVIKALGQLIIHSGSVRDAAIKAVTNFTIEKNKTTMQTLVQKLNVFYEAVEEERDKWLSFRKDEYFFEIQTDHEDEDKRGVQRHESIISLLETLDTTA